MKWNKPVMAYGLKNGFSFLLLLQIDTELKILEQLV